MAKKTISMTIDAELYEKATEFFKGNALSFSSGVSLMLRTMLQEGKATFQLTGNPNYEYAFVKLPSD